MELGNKENRTGETSSMANNSINRKKGTLYIDIYDFIVDLIAKRLEPCPNTTKKTTFICYYSPHFC